MESYAELMSGRRIEEAVSAEVLRHQPVLPNETLELLRPAPGDVIVDATLGAGGHAEALLERLGPAGKLYGIDRDPDALSHACSRLARFGESLVALRGNHVDIVDMMRGQGVEGVDGILADLGVSSMQLDDPRRGFSFMQDGPLDMRMDPDSTPSAAELLAQASEQELLHILRVYGEERRAGPIAAEIARRRKRAPIQRTSELAELVERVAGPSARKYRIHPATRTFQALRIAVNRELEGLERFLVDAVSLLRPGGRLAVISFHSLEDRIVKRTCRSLADGCTCPPDLPVCGCGRENLLSIVTRRAVRPGIAELDANPRARSARLRVAERL